ncbi:hypothetical protein [Geothrix sp. 21YS21S-2]|uniref:tetratricopeptide repeat protein n=1 Tax=Geothrix sp. 21YS21S-2 TaxID=3068893 RepID=UPI0027BA9BC7|nr:hypothetical protein [Geothrix sp. 21YS21S-2]
MATPFEPYLHQAKALFDAGDIVKAGQIWQAILKRDPASEEARAGLYKVKAHFDARATQDGLRAAPEPEPNRQTLTPPSPEVNSLLDAGCALYDAGLVAKAVTTWELALRQDPDNALAKGYLDGARRKLETEAAPAAAPEAPPPPPPPEDETDKLLRDGCTLYDMGQVEDALKKWERILASDPHNTLALAYANDARRDLGLAPVAGGARPSPAPAASREARAEDGETSRADQLVRDGVQIYDMGMADEAMEKWRQALALEPAHRDAIGYLEMARRDLEQASPASAPARPEPPPKAAAVPENLEPRILAAENLLRNQKHEEAAFAFQRLMEAGSRDARVLQGYQQARAVLSAREETPAAPEPAPPASPAPVDPPRSLTVKAPQRSGLKLPAFLGDHPLPRWLDSPSRLALAGGGAVLLALALLGYRHFQRNAALAQAVAAAKASAMAPIARRSQVVHLGETPDEIRSECMRALGDDPLTAFYRAQELLRLDPGDPTAAQLLGRARGRLASVPPVGSEKDLERSIKDGDLESARNAVGDQLRRNPDDPDLKARARMIYLALVQVQAAGEHFTEARELLKQGRAMFPQDRTWPARLRLLDEIQSMGKATRAAWIPLLG